MQTNIQKWGNSLGIRIPHYLLKKLSLHDGSVVEVIMQDNKIVLSPIKYNLRDFLEQISDNNKHDEFWQDNGKGIEEW